MYAIDVARPDTVYAATIAGLAIPHTSDQGAFVPYAHPINPIEVKAPDRAQQFQNPTRLMNGVLYSNKKSASTSGFFFKDFADFADVENLVGSVNLVDRVNRAACANGRRVCENCLSTVVNIISEWILV